MPNNFSLTQSFEEKRDLLTQMDYKRGNTLVSQRVYTYDALERPLTRQTSRNGQTINDSFVHTYRSELASAQVNGQTYAYDYDNIGNRRLAIDASDYAFYDANELNQYNSIRKNEDPAFVPTFDAAGNQTLVHTTTGTWTVTYNAENRPVIFQKTTDSVTTRITCTYDYMGRRATKKEEEITTDAEGNETTTVISNHRFIYRGYLQIGCCDLTRSGHPCLWLITWDPTQPVATRPLAIQKDGTWYTYGWDLTKNICEIFGPSGYIRSTYAYTPFGSVTASGDVEQPIQWSSEYHDNELALVYYNYRHYNPTDGRWINRDPIDEQGGWNLYGFVGNSIINIDNLGKKLLKIIISPNQVPLLFVDNLPETVAGQYNFNFTIVIRKINLLNRKAKPQIRYKRIYQSIYINKKLGMDPQKGKHNLVIKGHHQTTEWHERKHAEITINMWNKYVDKINMYEQETSECCYPYYELLALLTHELALSDIILVNAYFDKKYSYEANIDYKIINEKINMINISHKINSTKQVASLLSCIK